MEVRLRTESNRASPAEALCQTRVSGADDAAVFFFCPPTRFFQNPKICSMRVALSPWRDAPRSSTIGPREAADAVGKARPRGVAPPALFPIDARKALISPPNMERMKSILRGSDSNTTRSSLRGSPRIAMMQLSAGSTCSPVKLLAPVFESNAADDDATAHSC